MAAVLVSNGTLKFGTLSVTGPSQPTVGNGVCSLSPGLGVSVDYANYALSPAQQTLIASQTVNGYAATSGGAYSTTVSVTGTSLSTGPVVITSGVVCNGTYLLVSGDSATYFVNGTVANVGTGTATPVTIEALKYSAPTAQFANSQLATPASTATVNSVAASSTHIVYMTVQAGAYLDSQGQMALSFTYNSAAVQSIAIAGLSTSSAFVPSMPYATGQNTQITFLMSPAQAYQYSTGTGQSIGAYEIPVQITVTSAGVSSGTGTGTPISVQMTPGDGFYNTATGQLMQDLFRNPNTNANLVAPVVTASAITLLSY